MGAMQRKAASSELSKRPTPADSRPNAPSPLTPKCGATLRARTAIWDDGSLWGGFCVCEMPSAVDAACSGYAWLCVRARVLRQRHERLSEALQVRRSPSMFVPGLPHVIIKSV